MSTHILHIDDEPEIRDVFRLALTDRGYRVTSAASAQEALKAVSSETPQLIICDFHLADSDGLDLIRALKVKMPAVPVILLTGVLIDTRVADIAMGKLINTCLSKTSPLAVILAEVELLAGKP